MSIFSIFVIGAICGSFMNVCIYRLPRKKSVIAPRSCCPSCGQPIAWFDNIPILSFFMLGGKCRSCKKRISPVYVTVEILSGIIYAVLFSRFGMTPNFLIFAYLASALIVASFIDFRFHEIPDEITLPGIALALTLSVLYPSMLGKTARIDSFLQSAIGILAGGGSIFILGSLGEFIFKREAMGGGDVKLLAMIGGFLGWKLVLFTFFLAPFFGSVIGIILKLKEGKDVIPYGPYLSIAALVALLWGDKFLKALFLL